ncbi:MAG: hypothetical protein ACKV19_09630 [Verrucomicrobiales bacterium]
MNRRRLGDFPAHSESAAELAHKLVGRPISDWIDPVSGILNRDWRPRGISLHDLAGVKRIKPNGAPTMQRSGFEVDQAEAKA